MRKFEAQPNRLALQFSMHHFMHLLIPSEGFGPRVCTNSDMSRGGYDQMRDGLAVPSVDDGVHSLYY